MVRIIIFAALSIVITLLSWKALFKVNSHGFYRFFAWECIAWLFASSVHVWFYDPLSPFQILSWCLLIISVYLVIAGIVLMKKVGKPAKSRNENALYQFEQTTELIDTGIFEYIRHPLYSSLIFLTWGIFFKNINIELLLIAAISTIFLFLTAISDEKECVQYFGNKYVSYMKRSKRFIPFIF